MQTILLTTAADYSVTITADIYSSTLRYREIRISLRFRINIFIIN